MKLPIPWLRVFVEGVVIVGSILLAFGIEAWWDERQERAAERQILVRLVQEFDTNAQRLADTQETQQAMLAAAEVLFQLTGLDPPTVEPDSVAMLILSVMSRPTFTAVSGVLNSVISSGQLQIIEDDSLRAELAAWPDLVEAVNERERATRADVEQHFIPYLSDRIAWRTVDHLSGNPAYPEPSRFAPGWMEVLQDRRFENLLGNHHTYTQWILTQSDELEVRLQRIRDLLARGTF